MKYLVLLSALAVFVPQFAFADGVYDIVFPVVGEATFSNDFLAARSGGRTHNAIDLMAEKMTPVVAVVDGEITFAPMDEPSYGYMLRLAGDDGYVYEYVHLNNDTPGTDDGMGGPEYAYAEGVERGARVTQGEVIGWVGDSGNAEEIAPHLHFAMYLDDVPVNPYETLLAAEQEALTMVTTLDFDPAAAEVAATSISVDKGLVPVDDEAPCEADALIRTPEVSTVYYCGVDGARYAFQNEKTYFSWYADFSAVTYVTTEEMAAIPLRGVVTYKPGVHMIKLQTSPKVYAVAANGTLRWVASATVATQLYGAEWAKNVHDLSDAFFPAYEIDDEVGG